MMKEKDKYREKELEKIAELFAGEIDVDNGWNRLHERIKENGLLPKTIRLEERRRIFLRIAAAVLILVGLGVALIYINNSGPSNSKITASSGDSERNIEITLPDGSRVWLNRNSQLSYDTDPGNNPRIVTLAGEAFFEITPDPLKPFVIDAGKASIKVLGTSFNVITSNSNDQVEVFVKKGKVMLTGSSGDQSIVLEPGYIGKAGSGNPVKSLNENRNYLSWKTDTLVYNGQTLDVVFADLKRVFNINISADDPSIDKMSLSTTFFNLPHDTIIQLICNTFSLNYTKEGDVYRLSR